MSKRNIDLDEQIDELMHDTSLTTEQQREQVYILNGKRAISEKVDTRYEVVLQHTGEVILIEMILDKKGYFVQAGKYRRYESDFFVTATLKQIRTRSAINGFEIGLNGREIDFVGFTSNSMVETEYFDVSGLRGFLENDETSWTVQTLESEGQSMQLEFSLLVSVEDDSFMIDDIKVK